MLGQYSAGGRTEAASAIAAARGAFDNGTAGKVWTNTWGILNDAFEEGGFKYSGIGRARGARAMEEFQEVKTQIRVVAHMPVDHPRTQTS